MKKEGVDKKPAGFYTPPIVNDSLTSSIPRYHSSNDKVLQSIQRNELDILMIAESLIKDLDERKQSISKVKSLVKIALANMGYITHIRRAAIMKLFKLKNRIFTNGDFSQKKTGHFELFSPEINKTIAKEVETMSKINKARQTANSQPSGNSDYQKSGFHNGRNRRRQRYSQPQPRREFANRNDRRPDTYRPNYNQQEWGRNNDRANRGRD